MLVKNLAHMSSANYNVWSPPSPSTSESDDWLNLGTGSSCDKPTLDEHAHNDRALCNGCMQAEYPSEQGDDSSSATCNFNVDSFFSNKGRENELQIPIDIQGTEQDGSLVDGEQSTGAPPSDAIPVPNDIQENVQEQQSTTNQDSASLPGPKCSGEANGEKPGRKRRRGQAGAKDPEQAGAEDPNKPKRKRRACNARRGTDSARCKHPMEVYIWRAFNEVNNWVNPPSETDEKGVEWLLMPNECFVEVVHALCRMRVAEPYSDDYLSAVLHSCIMILSAAMVKHRESTSPSDLGKAERDIIVWCGRWKDLKEGSNQIDADVSNNENLVKSLKFLS